MAASRIFIIACLFVVACPASTYTEEFVLLPDQVQALESKLFELGYPEVRIPDTFLNQETMVVIAELQVAHHWEVTGYPTKDEYKEIMGWETPTNLQWVAVAAFPDGFKIEQSSSGIEANRAALKYCSKHRVDDPNSCQISITWGTQQQPKWIAVVKCEMQEIALSPNVAVSGSGYSAFVDNDQQSVEEYANTIGLLIMNDLPNTECRTLVTFPTNKVPDPSELPFQVPYDPHRVPI